MSKEEECKKISRRKFIRTGAIAGGAAVIGLTVGIPTIAALDKSKLLRAQLGLSPLPLVSTESALVSQTAVDGSTILKWIDPLPTFVGARVNAMAHKHLTIDNLELQQKILPSSFYDALSRSL